MNREQILEKLRLQDQHRDVLQRMKRSSSEQEYRELTAELARIQREAAALQPKRKPGRPRLSAPRSRRSQRKGTLGQQAEARALRASLAGLMAQVRKIKRQFAELASRGGPSK